MALPVIWIGGAALLWAGKKLVDHLDEVEDERSRK